MRTQPRVAIFRHTAGTPAPQLVERLTMIRRDRYYDDALSRCGERAVELSIRTGVHHYVVTDRVIAG